jgi:hypothetical protein
MAEVRRPFHPPRDWNWASRSSGSCHQASAAEADLLAAQKL